MKQMIIFFLGLVFAGMTLEGQEECCDNELFWVRGEYLLWSTKDCPVPIPLVTIAANSDPIPGAFGAPGSVVKLGAKNVDIENFNGFQIAAGLWVSDCPGLGAEGNYFFLPTHKHHKTIHTSGEPGSPNLAVPIFDVTGLWGLNGIPGETIYVLPGPLGTEPGFKGSFDLKLDSRLQGADFGAVVQILNWGQFELEGLGGFRWLQLNESLHFNGETTTVTDFSSEPAFFSVFDRFKTSNNFYGGQAGLRIKYFCQNWRLESTLKLGLGGICQRSDIHGFSQTSSGNLFYETLGTSQQKLRGGIFAQPTNIGKHSQTVLSKTVEATIRGSYAIMDNIELCVGYTFLWLNKVARPGDQLDRRINPTLTGLADASRATVGTRIGPTPFGSPGPAQSPQGAERPCSRFRTRDFWVKGLTVGAAMYF